MNTPNPNPGRTTGLLLATAATASLAFAGCATAPQSPEGYADVRSKLELLQSNTILANTVPVEIREAEEAVRIAEVSVGKDVALGKHRVYMADRKVEIAVAKATTRYAESQRANLSETRDKVRLDARTREADRARLDATVARSNSEAERAAAAAAAAEAAASKAELQRQIATLEAEATDRGLVVTLGDVLFTTGRSDLRQGSNTTLDKLVAFLKEYPNRDVQIEGHTDNVGSLEMNQTLSQQRADSVKSYLAQGGIQNSRINASGMGETQPVADNQSEAGRQQNRRVEIIIKNPPDAPVAKVN